jgi:hypothetical protein
MRELRERAEPILRIVVIILAALALFELAGIFVRWNPFRGVIVPQLPGLAASTNAPAGGGHKTNFIASAGVQTNGMQPAKGTNAAVSVTDAKSNSVTQSTTALNGTNFSADTNLAVLTPPAKTNAAETTTAETNGVARLEAKSGETNSIAATNSADKGTNVLLASAANGTNAARGSKKERKNAGAGLPPEMAGMNFNPFQPPGKSAIELPPAVKARISKITESEILGPVFHPMPEALLGIAGDVAFLRSASGQSGMVKPGDSLDDMKLLRIGMNRVLIEEAGEKKELTIFDGYGGDSLLPGNSTNENNHP